MSWLVVPKQGKRRAIGAAPAPAASPAAAAVSDSTAAQLVLAEARAAAQAAGEVGALQAYLDFEKGTQARRSLSQRPVHNETFLGNTLKQVASHNRRQERGGGGGRGADDRRGGGGGSRGGGAAARRDGPRKVKVVFDAEGTLGIYFEESAAGCDSTLPLWSSPPCSLLSCPGAGAGSR